MARSTSRVRLGSYGCEVKGKSTEDGSTACNEIYNRIVFMGGARVGKSSIISQFLNDKFPVRYKETIEELHRGEYEMQDGASLTLDILDTSGAYQFPAMRDLYISTANGFILVYAIDDDSSWEEVCRLREQITSRRGNGVPMVVAGNKSDLPIRTVPGEVPESIARYKWACGYLECSAKENYNIIEVFKELLNQAKVHYNLSPAVKKRRQSLPDYAGQQRQNKSRTVFKRDSCVVA